MTAFDLCIPLMDREEKCELVSDAQYAYGELGRYDQLYSCFIFSYICCCVVLVLTLISWDICVLSITLAV